MKTRLGFLGHLTHRGSRWRVFDYIRKVWYHFWNLWAI